MRCIKRLNENISKNEVKSKCLIGSKLYNKYLLVVKIVLIFIFVGMFVELILRCKSNPAQTGNFVGVFCSQLITVLIQVFGWITFVFAILEQIVDRNYKALIIDIRGNGGGDTAYWTNNIVPMLLNKAVKYTRYFVFRGGSFAVFAKSTGFATLVGEKTDGDGIAMDPIFV